MKEVFDNLIFEHYVTAFSKNPYYSISYSYNDMEKYWYRCLKSTKDIEFMIGFIKNKINVINYDKKSWYTA